MDERSAKTPTSPVRSETHQPDFTGARWLPTHPKTLAVKRLLHRVMSILIYSKFGVPTDHFRSELRGTQPSELA